MAEGFDLGAYAYAHRGLWATSGPVENSLTAFKAAANAGFGIELDVRPSRDGIPIVFHDPLLDRMTGRAGFVAEQDADTLREVLLNGSADSIPTLSDVLGVLPTTCPILCELKIDGETNARIFAQTVGAMLQNHSGFAAAMSFSEAAFAALPKSLMRGQLIAASSMVGQQAVLNLIERSYIARADYIACHVSDAEMVAESKAADLPLVVWTVTDRATHDRVSPVTDAVIFEHYDPR